MNDYNTETDLNRLAPDKNVKQGPKKHLSFYISLPNKNNDISYQNHKLE